MAKAKQANVEEKLIAFGLNSANISVVLTSSTLNADPGALPNPIVENFSELIYVSSGNDITANNWQKIAITMESDGTADIKLFKNGV